jgi:gamma-glutamylcyclotransferase (GGCT)/AIG2-like uncharacterized protein YtfP
MDPETLLLYFQSVAQSGKLTKGVLYHIDWYPAIVLSTEAEASVRGEIFMVDDDTLAELDLFEGKEYKRVLVNATDDQGHTQQAWIWAAWEKL